MSSTQAGRVSSIRPIEADAPNMLWAIDFHLDSTIDGMAIEIVFAAAGGPPKLLRMDKRWRIHFTSAATVL